jgi:glycosyltransferase involved in cell wall biosynthesis
MISGGIKTAIRHVEALAESGLAAAFATPHGQPPNWLETAAPCIPLSQVTSQDILVLEEINTPMLQAYATQPNPKLVFCQNQYYVHRGLAGAADYRAFGVSMMIVPSRSTQDFCQRRFPDMPLVNVPCFVDTRIFKPPSLKKLQIAFVPNKRPLEAAAIQDLFRAQHPQYRHIPWVALQGMREDQVATVFAESALHLSLQRFESFGLTALEAMAAGCLPVGFTGGGGDEYATTRNGFWAPEDDCVACVDQLARAVQFVIQGGNAYQDMVRDVVATAQQYSRARFTHKLTAFWHDEVAKAGRAIRPAPPFADTAPTPDARIPLRWVGAQFSWASLSLVNRELGRHLMASGEVELEAQSPRNDDFDPLATPRYHDYMRGLQALKRPAAVCVRHEWPPNFVAPDEGAWVLIQPWEFGGLPADWIAPLREQIDEYWVPTHWIKDCAIQSGVPAHKIQVVPNGVDTDFYTPDGPRYPLKTDKRFKLLFVGGLLARKGIDVALNAYLKTFTAEDDVCLVVKGFGMTTHYKGAGEDLARQIRDRVAAYPSVPAIEFIEEELSADAIAALYRACDALVHPYRGEGFGLPIAEAMASAKAVLVTNYGACLDFCDDETAYLIPAQVVSLPNDHPETHSPAGRWWAEPDEAALGALMRRVYQDPTSAQAVGHRARARIVEAFGWERAGEIALQRIRALAAQTPVRLR